MIERYMNVIICLLFWIGLQATFSNIFSILTLRVRLTALYRRLRRGYPKEEDVKG